MNLQLRTLLIGLRKISKVVSVLCKCVDTYFFYFFLLHRHLFLEVISLKYALSYWQTESRFHYQIVVAVTASKMRRVVNPTIIFSRRRKRPGIRGGIACLFGNRRVNVFAEFEPSTVNALSSSDTISMNDLSDAAIAIRAALFQGEEEIPHRLEQSKAGTPTQSTTKPEHRNRSNCFSITSWRQLSPKDVSFSDKSSLIDFHGQPSHPISTGERTAKILSRTVLNSS